jgi:hypothetical protein
MANIVQQTQLYSPGTSVTCPAFGSAVTAGNAIAAVAWAYPQSLAINSSPVIGDGTANVYQLATILLAPSFVFPVTFAAPPTGTGGTLTTGYAGPTVSGNTQTFVFSDGEIRKGNTTNGGTSVTWVTALTGTPGVSATTYNNQLGIVMWLCPNSVGGTLTPAFSTSVSFGINALYAAQIANVGTGNILLGATGNVQFGPGTSPNAINSGTITVNQNAVLFGFCADLSTLTSAPLSGGTGFAAQSPVWNTGTYNAGLAEDATINSSTAATFTALNGTNTFYPLAMALAGPGPFTPFTQTQFFVTDTIIQQ